MGLSKGNTLQELVQEVNRSLDEIKCYSYKHDDLI